MSNLYKVWSGDIGFVLIHAETASEAKLQYAAGYTGMSQSDVFRAGADMHCKLIFRGIDDAYPDNEDDEIRCVRLLDHDLIMAGIDHPLWAQERMVNGWWYHEGLEQP